MLGIANEDSIRLSQLFKHLNRPEVDCPICQVPYEIGYDNAIMIEKVGMCCDCVEDREAEGSI